MLGQASKLRYLCLGVDGLPCLPRLLDIQHLQLSCQPCRLLPSISMLGTLQTLQFRPFSLPICPGFVSNIRLDLRALPQLQGVMLYDFIPAYLALAKGTALHVTLQSLGDAQSSVWTSAGAAMKTFTLLAEDDMIESEADIPQWLLRPGGLDTLVLHLKRFGKHSTGAITLKGAFLSAKRLGIDCKKSLWVKVSTGSYQWELVNFHSDGQLYVLLDRSFPMRCAAFSFRFLYLHNEDLLDTLRQSGKPITVKVDEEGFNRRFHNPCHNPGLLDLHCEFYNNCRCGACWHCCRLDNFEGPRVPCNK